MFFLSKFIGDNVTHRSSSMFEGDIQANFAKLTEEIQGKSVCVIGCTDPIFARIFREEKGFGVVTNFSAHKYVRSL